MIDKRAARDNDHEIDDALKEISDTSILLNFQKAIVSLYPHLIDFQKKSPILRECEGCSPMSRWEMNFGWL